MVPLLLSAELSVSPAGADSEALGSARRDHDGRARHGAEQHRGVGAHALDVEGDADDRVGNGTCQGLL
jgi:hypothetical protein